MTEHADGWVPVELEALFLDPRQGSPVVVLREVQGKLILPIWIGPFEAQAIALALGGVRPPRPLTHDLLATVVQQLGARLARLEIHALEESTFFARLVLEPAGMLGSGRGGTFADGPVLIDSRPSDGLALALRTGAPIFLARAVLERAGIPRPAGVPSVSEVVESSDPEPAGAEGESERGKPEADEIVRAWSEWLAQARFGGAPKEPV